jgi:hypothetical protein
MALSALKQTVLRQLGRHDTLDGFGFAGSTFRRRTLRDVRAALAERGWLADRRRRSNACLALGLVLLGGGLLGPVAGLSALAGAASAGLGAGSLLAAVPRYPLTDQGARRRAAHQAYAAHRQDQIRTQLSDHPDQAAETLLAALPALVLERIATPHWLEAVATRLDDGRCAKPAPDWIRDEVDGTASMADACRTLARLLRALGACTPLPKRLARDGRRP